MLGAEIGFGSVLHQTIHHLDQNANCRPTQKNGHFVILSDSKMTV
jgi:hypothetical protein